MSKANSKPAYVQFAVRLTLIAIQLTVAAFFAFYAVMMWGTFIESPAWAKFVVFALVFWPILAFVVAGRNMRISSVGATSLIPVLTVAQLLIVVVIAILAS